MRWLKMHRWSAQGVWLAWGINGVFFSDWQASKNRPQEMQEAANILSASKSCFQHTALDYVNYITLAQARKVPSILSTVSNAKEVTYISLIGAPPSDFEWQCI